MPGIKPARRQATTAPVDEAPIESQPIAPAAGEVLEPGAADPRDKIPFFTFIKRFKDVEWDNYILYLYRLEPKIKNADGPAYIDKYSRAIDESDVKAEHGGGKYQVWLNDVEKNDNLRKHTFTIGGAPLLQTNNVIQGAAPAAGAPVAPAPVQDNGLAQVVRLLEQTLKEIHSKNLPQEKATEMLMETMQQANKAGIEIMRNSLSGQNNSATGNPLTDQLVKAAIDSMTAGKQDPTAQLTSTLKLIKEIQGPKAEVVPPVSPLKALKDDFGIDLKELLEQRNGGGDGGNSSVLAPLVASVPNLVDAIPKVFEQLNQGKRIELEIARTNLERERIRASVIAHQQTLPPAPHTAAAQTGAGNSGASPAGLRVDPLQATSVSGVDLTTPAAPASANQNADFDKMAELVVRSFNDGYNGGMAASVIKVTHPEIVAQLAPFLNDVAQLKGIVAGHPILSQMTVEDDYEEFVKEFFEEFTSAGEEDAPDTPAGVQQ